jgi:hypothetical protein
MFHRPARPGHVDGSGSAGLIRRHFLCLHWVRLTLQTGYIPTRLGFLMSTTHHKDKIQIVRKLIFQHHQHGSYLASHVHDDIYSYEYCGALLHLKCLATVWNRTYINPHNRLSQGLGWQFAAKTRVWRSLSA